MIAIEINGNQALANGPFPLQFVKLLSTLAGRKYWLKSSQVKFDASGINIRKLKDSDFEFSWTDNSGTLAEIEMLAELATQHAATVPIQTHYTPKLALYPHQIKALEISKDREAYALLLEMGLGKTAILIHNAGVLHCEGKLTGVLISAPKGVHSQWLAEQVPEHLDAGIETTLTEWQPGSNKQPWLKGKGLHFFAINHDALRTDKGFKAAEQFLQAHAGRNMFIGDESHNWKSARADRTKAAIKLAQMATYRRIATGTPIAKNVIDAWSQFFFLSPNILGHNYEASFRARYCIMGGFENRMVVAQKNVEEFYGLIAPHSFRLTKAEALNLPEKIYVQRSYEMSDNCRKHYQALKKTMMTQLENGEIVDVNNAVTLLLRLQQVVCGYLPEEGDEKFEIFDNGRLEILDDIISQVDGQVIIWARFRKDIERIMERLGNEAVAYYGGNESTRTEELKLWLNKQRRFLVSNPQAGGTGLNLQGKCNVNVYYSNNFRALDRWQSEDRTHRMGTKGAVTYIDLVAEKSVDKAILRNLRDKKSISDLTLDQIRQAIKAE